jgi:hypothetical protein
MESKVLTARETSFHVEDLVTRFFKMNFSEGENMLRKCS